MAAKTNSITSYDWIDHMTMYTIHVMCFSSTFLSKLKLNGGQACQRHTNLLISVLLGNMPK